MPNLSAMARLFGLMSTPTIMSAPTETGALDDVEPDSAEAEDDDVGARLDSGRVDNRAQAGGDAAADIANLVEGRVLANLGEGDLGQDGEVREGRGPHVVVERLAAEREPARAVRHDALALGDADRLAQVGLAGQAILALAALGRVQRDDVIARLDACYPGPGLDDDPGPLVAEYRGDNPSGSPPESVKSSEWQMPVALISTITSPDLGPSQLNRLDLQWFGRLERHRG